jgi:hypothetical protein
VGDGNRNDSEAGDGVHDRNEDGDDAFEVLRRHDRMRGVDLWAPHVQDALDAVGRDITERGDHADVVPLRRRRPRAAVIGGVVVAAALLTAATPAAVQWVDLHTGWFGSEGSTENDTSEFLDTGSPELGPYLDTLAAKYPLPPGGTFDEAKRNAARNRANVQRAGLEILISGEAQCQWMRWWLDGNAEGDAAKVAAATAELQEVPDWPITRETDGGGVVAAATAVADAAAAGDPAPIEQYWAANCVAVPDRTDADVRITPEPEGGR